VKKFQRSIHDWNRKEYTRNEEAQSPVFRVTVMQKLEGESDDGKWKVTETCRVSGRIAPRGLIPGDPTAVFVELSSTETQRQEYILVWYTAIQ
jgi:hypothetical protein